MKLSLTTHNQEQQVLDISSTLYQALTVNLPGRQITVDFQTGQVYNRDLESQELITTAELVTRYRVHQRKRRLSNSTIASYRSVLRALAAFAPEWPPTPEAIDLFLDGYADRNCSPVTLAEYWKWLNTWFKWTQQMGYIDLNPMRMVDRREMPDSEAGVIEPQDFVKIIKLLQEVIANSRPRQVGLPYERAIRDLAIIRFTYATGCRRGRGDRVTPARPVPG